MCVITCSFELASCSTSCKNSDEGHDSLKEVQEATNAEMGTGH